MSATATTTDAAAAGTAVTPPAPAPSAATDPTLNRPLITVSIMLATIMQALDTTIANVALPHIQGSVAASSDQISWVLTSYIVAAAIATPLTGWLTGNFGVKRIFMVAVVGFTAASALCGLAESLLQIVGFRLLQGLFGAALVPLSQAVLLNINPPAKHASAMAIWGMGIMVGPIAGPALGGWLTDNYSWRWVFYINLPIGLAAFLGILIFIKDTVRSPGRHFDLLGFATLSLGIASMQMMLDRGELKDWFGSTEIWVEATLALLGFYWFIIHTATAERPFLNRALLRDKNFVAGTVAIFMIGVILYATLALLPPMLQELYDYPVVTTGLVTAPRGVGTMVAMMIVGRIMGKIDTRLIILTGLLLTALSLYQMTGFTLDMGMEPIITSGIIQGFGLGFTFVPLSTISFATLTPSTRTDGTAFFSLSRNIGSSIGISAVSALLTQNTQVLHSNLVQHIRPDNPAMYGLGRIFPMTSQYGLQSLNGMVNRQASMIAYLDDYKLMMVIALLTAPLVLILRTPKKAGPVEKVAVHMD